MSVVMLWDVRDIDGSWFIMEGYRGGSEQLSFYWFTGSSQCLLQQVQILHDSSSIHNIFDNPSCQSAIVCMYVYSESVGQSLVFPLIAAGTQWAGILCLFFWLVLVLVLIVVHVPCIWITVVNYSVYVCDSDRFEFLSVSIRVLKHTFLLCLE